MVSASLKIYETEIRLSQSALICILSHLRDVADQYGSTCDWDPFLIQLSSDGDPNIRKLVASFWELPLQARANLLADPSPEVVSEYLEGCNPVSSVDENWAALWLEAPYPSLHKNLAYRNGDFDENIRALILKALITSPSNEIRHILADDDTIPEDYLQELSKDPDPEVSGLAELTLFSRKIKRENADRFYDDLD